MEDRAEEDFFFIRGNVETNDIVECAGVGVGNSISSTGRSSPDLNDSSAAGLVVLSFVFVFLLEALRLILPV